MHSYYFRAVENYKDIFKLMCATKIEHFNSRSYFYCINNRINSLAITVDLSKVPLVIAEGQSYIELPKELQNRTKQIEGRKRAILSKSRQSKVSLTTQLSRRERSHLTRTESPCLPSWVRGKGKERMQSPTVPLFQR